MQIRSSPRGLRERDVANKRNKQMRGGICRLKIGARTRTLWNIRRAVIKPPNSLKDKTPVYKLAKCK